MIIEARNLHKDFGGTVVLDGAELAVAEGEKVGLIGRNGAGKSTLIRILTGEDDDYSGTVRLSPGRRLAAVPQYFPDFAGTARDYLSADAQAARDRLRAAEAALAEAGPEGPDSALAEYGRCRDAYDDLGGDGAEEAAERFLASIGLADAADTPTAALSGGERNVLALGRAVLSRSDLIILDEPGNHLDAWGLAWLEHYLAGIPQAVLIVSHNRYLLDRVVARTVELEAGRTTSWAGGYSAYRMEKLRLSAAQGADWQADRKRLERMEALVKRFREICSQRPDPSWGKRLHARVTALERAKAEAVAKPVLDGRRIVAEFRAEASKADIAVAVAGYRRTVPGRTPDAPERVLFQDADLSIRTGERVGLVGPNGSGKTTFLADLVALSRWDDKVLRIGPSLTVGYCAQHQEVFDSAKTVRDEFLGLGAFGEDEVFGALRRFLFRRVDLDKKIGDLSGGERNRLQLARAVMLGADFLILDEPTNHLDIPAREAIEEALADFAGTLLAVSHDRAFLDKLVDRVVSIDEAGFVSWDGNFSEFWFRSGAGAGLRRPGSAAATLAARGRVKASEARAAAVPAPSGAASADAARKALLAARIERLETERGELERQAAAALAAKDFKEGGRRANEAAALAKTIDRLYAEWAG